jgi:hypothetical protein
MEWRYLVVSRNFQRAWLPRGRVMSDDLGERLTSTLLVEDMLALCGREGWELVTVGEDDFGEVCYFKQQG